MQDYLVLLLLFTQAKKKYLSKLGKNIQTKISKKLRHQIDIRQKNI